MANNSDFEFDAPRHESMRLFGNVPFNPAQNDSAFYAGLSCFLDGITTGHQHKHVPARFFDDVPNASNNDEAREFSTPLSDRQREIEMRTNE